MILERKRRRLNENNPDKKSDNYYQSDTPTSKRTTVNSINESISEVQGPVDDDNENKLQKAWKMEMLMNDGHILTNTMNEAELMSDDEKIFSYTWAIHSNHSIQYHMHQIME